GIGSFAPTTMLLRSFKQIHDRVLPGTLNVSCTIPVVAEAFIFISVIEVEPITLVSLLASAAVGAVLGAGIVSKWDEKKVQLVMGIALLATAFLMLSGQLGWTASLGTGTAIGLTGIKLVIAVVINFILGALMTAGIGLYAPCMAMIYMMGLSPKVAFPIMMGSCAFLMPPASVRFIKEGAYNKKASMAITIGGLVGVFIAAYIVKSLPIKILTYLVIVVVTYTAFTLLRDSRKAAKQAE
ncbi:MAG: sulfite exporter TauE/SafE family protein, partial [Tissierellales bacterium]|nr:sulfite exporter TauE/SafE family protein [Tissierellales bacterium]